MYTDNHIFKNIFFTFIFISFYLVLTAWSCSGEDNRPELTSKYPDKHDIELDPVYLRYDLEKFINDCQTYGYSVPDEDLMQLSEYNNMILSSSWLDFYSLFINTDRYEGSGPEAKFIFSQPDCKGSVSIVYNKFDEKLCEHRIISNAPKINNIHLVEFSAHTIKTSRNNISVKWSNAYTVTGQGAYITIDKQGTIDHPTFIFTRGTRGGLQVAARLLDNKYCVLENTVSEEIEPGLYQVSVVEEQSENIGVMNRDVCSSGAMNEEIRWSSPAIVELQEISDAI